MLTTEIQAAASVAAIGAATADMSKASIDKLSAIMVVAHRRYSIPDVALPV